MDEFLHHFDEFLHHLDEAEYLASSYGAQCDNPGQTALDHLATAKTLLEKLREEHQEVALNLPDFIDALARDALEEWKLRIADAERNITKRYFTENSSD